MNNKQKISDVTFFYNISIQDNEGYEPDQGYGQSITIKSDSVAYTYIAIDGKEYSSNYGAGDGFWSDFGSYLYIYTSYADSIKNSDYPGFLNDYNEGHSKEKWYYELESESHMILTNNEYGSEKRVFLEKTNDYECSCYADRK